MSYSTRAMRDEDWASVRHFTPDEFRDPSVMGYEFMRLVDEVREQAGVSMTVTSSSRTPARNTKVGGAKQSAHMDLPICNAIDVLPSDNYGRFAILKAAMALGFTRIGIYANGSIHLDKTESTRPAPRLWVTSNA